MGGGEPGEEGGGGLEHGLPVSSLCKATSCLVRSGVWEEENLARKVEGDWNMVYLARREGVTAKGTVTWKFQVCHNAKFCHIFAKFHVRDNAHCSLSLIKTRGLQRYVLYLG